MTDYASRKEPSKFKPLIDEALITIAEEGGGDVDAVKEKLDAIDPSPYPQFSYMVVALARTQDALLTRKVEKTAPGHWFLHFLKDPYCREPSASRVAESRQYYPDAAQEALEQADFVAGSDADVVGLWEREDGRKSLYHAHMEGFWILGEDTVDFVQSYADEF